MYFVMGLRYNKTSDLRKPRGNRVIIQAKVTPAHVNTVLKIARKLPPGKRQSLEMMARLISWEIPASENMKVDTVKRILLGLAKRRKIGLPKKSKRGGPRDMTKKAKK